MYRLAGPAVLILQCFVEINQAVFSRDRSSNTQFQSHRKGCPFILALPVFRVNSVLF